VAEVGSASASVAPIQNVSNMLIEVHSIINPIPIPGQVLKSFQILVRLLLRFLCELKVVPDLLPFTILILYLFLFEIAVYLTEWVA